MDVREIIAQVCACTSTSGTELSILHIGIRTSENGKYHSSFVGLRCASSKVIIISNFVVCYVLDRIVFFFFSFIQHIQLFSCITVRFLLSSFFHRRAIQCKVWASETNNIYKNVQRSENSRKVATRKRRTREVKKKKIPSRANLSSALTMPILRRHNLLLPFAVVFVFVTDVVAVVRIAWNKNGKCQQ